MPFTVTLTIENADQAFALAAAMNAASATWERRRHDGFIGGHYASYLAYHCDNNIDAFGRASAAIRHAGLVAAADPRQVPPKGLSASPAAIRSAYAHFLLRAESAPAMLAALTAAPPPPSYGACLQRFAADYVDWMVLRDAAIAKAEPPAEAPARAT